MSRDYPSCYSCDYMKPIEYPNKVIKRCTLTGKEIALAGGQHYPKWCPQYGKDKDESVDCPWK